MSELLGSFGDNELSPECLDGALRLLKGTYPLLPSKRAVHSLKLMLYACATVGAGLQPTACPSRTTAPRTLRP